MLPGFSSYPPSPPFVNSKIMHSFFKFSLALSSIASSLALSLNCIIPAEFCWLSIPDMQALLIFFLFVSFFYLASALFF